MLDKANAIASEIVRLRRDIHAHPELAFQEVRTAQLVAETLREIGGIDIRTGVGKTGVVGHLGTGDGPTIGIRADMDALPIDEATGLPFASQNPGVMHACGHDAHTAILLGVAHLLKQEFAAGNLRGNVRFLFQPAEEAQDAEGLSGAPRMINDGALDGVDHVIALHVDSGLPVGKITIREGASSAAVDSFRGWITGSGGHGAYPHLGTDPLWMLLPVMQALHGIVARRVNPMHPAVVSLGVVRGGTASNVIPAEVYLEGTLRSFDPQVREQLLVEVERAFAVARAVGGDYRLEIERGYPAGHNDATVSDWISATVTDLIGADAIDRSRTGMGAEDFAYMTQKAPGAMFMLGAAIDDGVSRGHHTPIFDIDERALPIGAAILAETARRYLAGNTNDL
ncbi:M20 metallopeptidase family protein [Roseiflexus castenholzii]|uniref:Amidohydrolase n=1 Tax=Roseiflexus castenholzii (strain DSM 13941 / HLO8) TaxID=383372 RepID=A7NKU0_ROSCS|nr:M20 family metallopeptidase [Roseiflexus castenholzii]ABU58110.1 amidohydrolase [Roseiflexus castenholzii DSM 13941]